jgi:hypothetical protein
VHNQPYQVKDVLGLDPADPRAQPYQLLFASEQGWPYPACCVNKIRGRNICYAQALSTALPQVVGVTHNFFHDNAHGSEQGGQDYGLIPGNVSGNLSNGVGHPTFDAYTSTAPRNWDLTDGHYCCTNWRMGCKTKNGTGTLDPLMQDSQTRITVHGWAWDERSARGGGAPVQVRISFTGIAVPSRTVFANITRQDLVDAVSNRSISSFFARFLYQLSWMQVVPTQLPPPPLSGLTRRVLLLTQPTGSSRASTLLRLALQDLTVFLWCGFGILQPQSLQARLAVGIVPALATARPCKLLNGFNCLFSIDHFVHFCSSSNKALTRQRVPEIADVWYAVGRSPSASHRSKKQFKYCSTVVMLSVRFQDPYVCFTQ